MAPWKRDTTMRVFRTLIILLLLLCLVPPLSLLAAGLIARWAGCELDPNVPVTCTVLGGDYGGYLFGLVDFGYYAVETIPAFVALLAGWVTVEIVRRLGRSRKAPAPQGPAGARKGRTPQTPAASRNRARGS
jgi:hypothetical protein